jgi:hypothetical protein
MEHCREKVVLGQVLEDRTIDVLHVLLEHVIEVPNRLVEVEPKDEPDRSHWLADHE